MRDRGLNVRCAASPFEDRFDAFAARASSLGIACDAVKYYNAAGGSRIAFAAALTRYFRQLHPRVVHLQTGNGFVNPTLAMTLAAARRGPRIVTLHGVRSRELTEAKHIRDQNISERFFHAIITPTNYSRESYLACAAKPRPKCVHAIGSLADSGQAKSRCSTREQLGIACDASVVLFAARVVETKGPTAAIRAFENVLPRHPKALLLIAGDGPDLERCKQVAIALGEHVRFLDQRDDVSDLMAASDVFITPSHFESFGLTTLEAMARGTSVVAFDIPATRELLGGFGRLAPLHDETALARELELTLANPGVYREQLRSRYKSRYSADAVVRQHLKIYGLSR
jgi:glycosyltransferase involved in cell wall biosynthesis